MTLRNRPSIPSYEVRASGKGQKFTSKLLGEPVKLAGEVSWGLPIRYVPDTAAGMPLFNIFIVHDLLHATANITSLPFKKSNLNIFWTPP